MGDESGTVTQYGEMSSEKEWKKVTEYNLEVGKVQTGILLGKLAVFGGNNGKVQILDFLLRHMHSPEESAVRDIHSLEVCKVSKTLTVLAVGGNYPDYSESKTDLLDISEFLEKVKPKHLQAKKMEKNIKELRDQSRQKHKKSSQKSKGNQDIISKLKHENQNLKSTQGNSRDD